MSHPACVDLLVIGGGINGVGIGRDAAGRGLSVVLIERADLAAGERLPELAPHLVVPIRFVLPYAPELRPRWQIRLGLFVYDRLGGRRRLAGSGTIDLSPAPFGEGLQDHYRDGFVYSDCRVDDSRLVVANAVDAAARGARILTRTAFVSAAERNGCWHVVCEETERCQRFELQARAIVNAAGPWIEKVLAGIAGIKVATRARLVKGSHIIVPRIYPGDAAFLLQLPDRRVVFAIPYERAFTLIGTTDVEYDGDLDHVAITDAEVRYLCDAVNRYLRRQITAADVRATFAGVRALVDDAARDASKITRDYRLELASGSGGAPVLCVFGGKITTYRRLAELAVERLARVLGRSGAAWTHRAPLPGGDIPHGDLEHFVRDVQRRWRFLSGKNAQRLARAYGTHVERILGNARSAASLGDEFGCGLSEAEVDYLRLQEWACTVDDVLWRRTKARYTFFRQPTRSACSLPGAIGRTTTHRSSANAVPFLILRHNEPCPDSEQPVVKHDFLARLAHDIDDLKQRGLYKPERVLASPQQAVVRMSDGRTAINLCANNYLGLANDERVREAAKVALDRYGYGMASVRFICGTHALHKELEDRLTHFLGTEDTILYTSCFDANGGLFEALLGEDDAVISDSLNHASIIDGIRLCKAQRFRYANDDLDELETRLKETRRCRVRLIATDGVFSMDGVIARLREICELADRYDALVMVDDSHATGFVGEKGRGTHEYRNVMGCIDILTGTLGKALGGGMGGYASGRREIIAWLRQRSRPYLFSNSIPPFIAAAAIRVLDILEDSDALRRQLWENTAYFRERMTAAGFNIVAGEHPIVPVMLGDAKLASNFAHRLLEHGVYVIGFSYPVVPHGKARIRTQMSAAHQRAHLDQAIDAFVRVGRELGVIA